MIKPRAAILGVGQMGSAAAKRLSRAGYEVILWNRTREKAERLAGEIGATVAPSVQAAVERAEYALVFLLDDDAVAWLAASLPRIDGLVVLNHSTVTPRLSIMAARRVEDLGGCYIEAPVIGGPKALEEGRARLIVAGEERCIRRASEPIRSLASAIISTGRLGSAMAAKLAYNMTLMTSLAVLGEALLLARSYGVEAEQLLQVMEGTPLGGLASRYMDRVAGLDPGGARMHIAAKDLEHASRASYQAGVPNPVSSAAGELYRLAQAMGCGGLYYANTARILEGCREAEG